MVYEACTGDTRTLDKFRETSAGDKQRNRSVISSKRSESMHSRKEKPSEIGLPENSEDINPKLSLHDTPVSGEKVVKPGRRYPSRPRTVDFDRNSRDNSNDYQLSASKNKPRQEVRFDSEPGVKNDSKKSQHPLSERVSQRSDSNRSVKGIINKSKTIDHDRQYRNNKKQPDSRSPKGMNLSKSSDRIHIDHWMSKNVADKLSDKDRINTISSRSRHLSKSRERIPNLDKDYIRSDSIKRIQKITLSTNKSEHSKDHSLMPHEPSKRELTDKFSCLKDKRKQSKEGSTARFATDQETSKPHSQAFQDDHYKNKYVTDMPIDKILDSRIVQLHEWIKELGYLKYYSITDDLPDECKNGSLFFKLINHLERSPVLKGENISNRTAVKVNFDKVFNHLRRFEKFNPRYLSGLYFLVNGNKHVFWGFMDDIRHVYGNKISKTDKRFKKANNIKDQEAVDDEDFTYSLSENRTRSNSRRTDRGINQLEVNEISSRLPTVRDGYSFRQKSTGRTAPVYAPAVSKIESGYSSKYLSSHRTRIAEDDYSSKKAAQNINVIRSKARFIDLENTTKPKLKKLRLDVNNLADLEGDCRAWFEELKIRANYQNSLFENPVRNGFILCYLCSLVFHRKLRNVCKEPKTISECKNNIESALNVLRSTASAIPYELLWQTDEIMKGNPAVVWPLIASIKFISDSNSMNVPEVNLNRGANLSSVNVKTLPYSNVQIAQLEQSLMTWMIDTGAFNQDLQLPGCFEDAIDSIGQGYVLYKIVHRITGVNIKGLHQRPTCMANYTHNVRKLLEYLLTVKNMSRKFLWKVEEVVSRERLVIVGLLEDLHRLSVGMPKRKDPDYFADGPLIIEQLTQTPKSNYEQKREGNDEKTPEKKMTGQLKTNLGKSVINHFRIRNGDAQTDPDTNQILKLINEKPHAKNPLKYQAQESVSNRQSIDASDRPEHDFDMIDLPVDKDQLNKTIRLLLLLNMPRIVERESWQSNVWTLFSDGYVSMII